jgi:hypothetical protein
VSEPIRHHYIPVFHLSQWAGDNGRLCEYSRPHKTVKAKRKHPSATGYVNGLYTIPGLPLEDAQYVEKRFFQFNDDWAAKALQVFLLHNPGKRDLTAKEKVGWARFIYSLMLRTPEQILSIKQRMVEQAMTMPAQAFLPTLINSQTVIEEISMMSFHTAQVTDNKHPLLTSHRPIIMTNGLRVENAHIVIPISPNKIFIAARERKTFDYLAKLHSNDLVQSANNKVAEQAIKYVYGTDDSQLRFVANRLGKRVKSTPLG